MGFLMGKLPKYRPLLRGVVVPWRLYDRLCMLFMPVRLISIRNEPARSLSGLPGRVRERERTMWVIPHMTFAEYPCVTVQHTISRQVSDPNTYLIMHEAISIYTKTPMSLSSHKAEATQSDGPPNICTVTLDAYTCFPCGKSSRFVSRLSIDGSLSCHR
jgi:hypothetical protein